MKIGDKVIISYRGTLENQVGKILCFLPHPKSDLVVVDLQKDLGFIGGGSTNSVVINLSLLKVIEDYADHVIFEYKKDNGSREQRNLLVTKENDIFIEGHDMSRDGFRRFKKTNIVGKIFRAGKP